MPIKLSQICSYPAKTEVLETLYLQSRPIALRQIAYVTSLPVRSVELALKDLVNDQLVSKKQSGQRVLFWLNRKDKRFEFLARIFESSISYRVQENAGKYRESGTRVLKFIIRTNRMIAQAQRSYRGT